ncbi:retrovirus-related Pol polyprotein from transposon 17.6 [Elysia marginata]|uniref:Retrovirus-related Pol polyprotein from transposon 17.6 n=1 Tax=Elysia marginata TaxID=1093978 RepID=A0AAV4EMM7_9GAST|nr:retrovirus-related Pol polyprotein from transposon 17.6 [Elysia marginata]
MHKKPILRPDPIAIYGYSNSEKLDVRGRFTASIQCNGEKTQAAFYVVQTPKKACNLLSATTSQELKTISLKNNVTISENLFEGFGKIAFLGHVFGEDGIYFEPQKIKCISQATVPTNIAAVRSFLGMKQYVSRFIRGYATITEPLRMLTKKTQPWTWGKHLKKMLLISLNQLLETQESCPTLIPADLPKS